MLSRYPQFVNTILPKPFGYTWRVYGPFLLLATSLSGLFFLDGKCVNEYYLGFYGGLTNSNSGMAEINPGGGTFISRFGAFAAALIANPLTGLCLLGVIVSYNQLHYRYFFRPALARNSWGGWFSYVVVLLVVAETLTNYGTRWLGNDNRLARDIVLWSIIFWIMYGIWKHFRETRTARRALTEQATQAELAALKAQINPHFLFNSLNNIFGTALTEGGQRTPDGVQQLSRLMRYQLEQTSAERVDMQTELNFLDEYVQFHRQLLPASAALTHQFEWDEQPVTIAPLLLTPLVDYALQHRQVGSHVPIRSQLSVKKQFLHYQLTYPAKPSVPDNDILTNVEQRLNKLYAYFTLKETSANQINTLDLTINLPS